VLRRGLVPRLSGGTLQLSIRCSSIHFRPSRSLPVSDAGALEGKAAEGKTAEGKAAAPSGATRSGCLSWADAAGVKPTRSEMRNSRCHGLIMTSRDSAGSSNDSDELNNIEIQAATRNLQPPHRFLSVLVRRGASAGNKETQMGIKRLILTGCSVVVLSAGTAFAGPCDTSGRTANLKDAGSGPASQSTSQTVGAASDSKEHPPTSSMNRASGETAASSQDAQRQMQGQPTAAQQAEGAKPGGEMGTQEAQREMHAQPSVAEQPKGEKTADKDC